MNTSTVTSNQRPIARIIERDGKTVGEVRGLRQKVNAVHALLGDCEEMFVCRLETTDIPEADPDTRTIIIKAVPRKHHGIKAERPGQQPPVNPARALLNAIFKGETQPLLGGRVTFTT
ncbi:MAG: hypothetical protein WAU28_04755 [Candidatus Moraniibacteriota bacterium]